MEVSIARGFLLEVDVWVVGEGGTSEVVVVLVVGLLGGAPQVLMNERTGSVSGCKG